MKTPSMPIPMGMVKDFDAKNPKQGFEIWSDNIIQTSKKILCQDGYHGPMSFFVMNDGYAIGIQLSEWLEDHESKNMLSVFLHEAAQNTDLYGVAIITEAWAYKSRGKDDHIVKQLTLGEISVSELRPEDKEEILMIHIQSRDGMDRLASIHFSKDMMLDPDGNVIHKIILGEEITTDGDNKGRFSGLWKNHE